MGEWENYGQSISFFSVFFLTSIFHFVDAKERKRNKASEMKVPVIRLNRVEWPTERLAMVRNEIQQLEKLEAELKAKMDKTLNAKSKF